MKSVRIRSFSDPYFPEFGLNTERYSIYLSVLSPNARKYGLEKLRIQTLFRVIYPITFHLASIRLRIKFPEVFLTEQMLHKYFCARYFVPLKRIFGARMMHNMN